MGPSAIKTASQIDRVPTHELFMGLFRFNIKKLPEYPQFPQGANRCFLLYAAIVVNNPVKNPYVILRQKEQDVARVRKEIQALLIAIPLLADADLSWDELKAQLVDSCQSMPASARNGMAELELYFPFVKHLQLSDSSMV